MTEAIIILMNMRGGCATVGEKVHALFKVTNNRRRTSDVVADEVDLSTLQAPEDSALATQSNQEMPQLSFRGFNEQPHRRRLGRDRD
jgi:hypothetical protein